MSNPRNSVKSYPVVLPAAPTDSSQATTKQYVDQQDALKADLTGATFTGPVILEGAPLNPNEAATKAYVDSLNAHPHAVDVPSDPTGDVEATNVQAAIAELAAEKVRKVGDTMMGALYLPSTPPASAQEAANKGYVDTMGSLEFSFLPDDWTWDNSLKLYYLVISHTLNRRPRVTIYDSIGVEILGDVIYNVIGVNGLMIRLKLNPAVRILLT